MKVIRGTVKVLSHRADRVVRKHYVNLGVKIAVSNWPGRKVKIYETPDAVDPGVTVDGTTIELTLTQPDPLSFGSPGAGAPAGASVIPVRTDHGGVAHAYGY